MASSVDWINHIEAWQQSGLKQVVYCQQQGLNYHSFSARLCTYRKRQKAALPTLIPVQVQPSVAEAIVVRHVKGHQVDLPVSVSAAWLAELLRCLD